MWAEPHCDSQWQIQSPLRLSCVVLIQHCLSIHQVLTKHDTRLILRIHARQKQVVQTDRLKACRVRMSVVALMDATSCWTHAVGSCERMKSRTYSGTAGATIVEGNQMDRSEEPLTCRTLLPSCDGDICKL